jgi:hypothetical protein
MALWVKSGKTRPEHLLSAFDLIPDEQADIRAGQLSAKTGNQHPVGSLGAHRQSARACIN